MGNRAAPQNNSCEAAGWLHYDCAAYSAIGGGGKQTQEILGKKFCRYTTNGDDENFAPYVISAVSKSGGQW
jgi:hypothetical protein